MPASIVDTWMGHDTAAFLQILRPCPLAASALAHTHHNKKTHLELPVVRAFMAPGVPQRRKPAPCTRVLFRAPRPPQHPQRVPGASPSTKRLL